MQVIRVNASTPYEIWIGDHLLDGCGDALRAVSQAQKAIIVTDDNVDRLYRPAVARSLEAANFITAVFVFPHGEASKSHQTLTALYDFLSDQNVTRGDLLIALGGGVVGDLTGYCAATYLRGLDYIQIPTTLLAQIDSSVGGKTAVDTSRGKNLVGAFWQPKRVICDTDTLATLSPEIFSDGMAEAIKYGLIRDADLFDLIANQPLAARLEEMIARCIAIKAEIVEADEFDRGERMLLNFGHTIGHAIERQYHYKRYTHGSAVGVGMVMISQLFENEGLTPKGTTEQIRTCLKRYQLPCAVAITPDEIYAHSVNDKKRDKSNINLIVLDRIGSASIRTLSVEEYRQLLDKLPPQNVGMRLTPAPLSGQVAAPPSKSYAHRALIAAALADGVSTIEHIALSQDISATVSALREIGAQIQMNGNTATVVGISEPPKSATIHCKESGSTLRFLIPLTAALGISTQYHGEGRLPVRPLSVYHQSFAGKGVNFTPNLGMPFTLSGKLTAGRFILDGTISSQFITGLLFALPLLEGESEIILTTPLESKDYVNMTLELLELAGISVEQTQQGYRIPGGQRYQPFSYTVEGDYSQAAFFLTAGAIGTPITCTGLNPDSQQGDRRILDLLRLAGGSVKVCKDHVTVCADKLAPFTVDGSETPDLVPILAVLAACCEGDSEIYNIARLKFKESDRIHTTAEMLRALGVMVEETDDRLAIRGVPSFSGGKVNSFNDHRIAMATAIAAIRATDEITLSEPFCIRKSFPDFYQKYNTLGGKANVIIME